MTGNFCWRIGRINSGIVVCLAMFALGGAMLVAFFRAPRGGTPAPEAEWGVPSGPVRIVACRMADSAAERDDLLAVVRRAAPDFLLVRDVAAADIDALAHDLQLDSGGTPSVYYPTQNQVGSTRGNAILAKYPLYDGRSIPNPGGESFGVWASTVIDGRKFIIASVDVPAATQPHDLANLMRAWHALHDPPIIVGGGFALGPVLSSFQGIHPSPDWPDGFHLVGPWQIARSGVLNPALQHGQPIWMEIEPAGNGPPSSPSGGRAGRSEGG